VFGLRATSGGTRARDGRCVRGHGLNGPPTKRPAAGEARAYPGDMNSKPTEIAREGLAAWRKGDFGTVEEILDRNVEWHATEPGEWDCHGRGEVMETLRERYEQGFAKGDLQFREGGERARCLNAGLPYRGRGPCGCRAEVIRTRHAADAVAFAIAFGRLFASSAMIPGAATGSRSYLRTLASASRVDRGPALPPQALL